MVLVRAVGLVGLCSLVLSLLTGNAAADRQVAFVVGNSRYEKVDPLPNARRDAAAVADRLRDLGFEVTEVFDGDAFALNRAADQFLNQARGSDLALFYFAGHGVQLFDQNFLLARDVDPQRLARVEDLGLDLNRFMAALRRSGTIRQALLIDACRNNPFSFEETVRLVDLVRKAGIAGSAAAADPAGNRGLARVILAQPGAQASGAETLLFFAAQPGQVSFDGAGQNSFYVEGLKEALSKPGRPLTEVFREVSAYVRTVTKGEQVPQVVSDWTGDVTLGGRTADRVEYQVFANANPGQPPLTKPERDLVLRAATGFGKFHGDFIAKAGIGGDLPSGDMSDADRERAQKLGNVPGFSIKYDLDRDGRDEILHVYFRQTGYAFAIESQGVTADVASCVDGDTVQAIEVALKDINGDRRPEIWVAYETEQTTGWGKFCVLEFKGLPNLADRRRSSTGQIYAGFSAFRTLLRGEAGWGVTVANDNTIKACGGSNCHNPWSYIFDGEKFRLTDDGGEKPSAAAAIPFGDEGQRAANLFAQFSRVGSALAPQSWQAGRNKDGIATALSRIGLRTEFGLECQKNNADAPAYETLVLRDKPAPNASGGAEIVVEPTLAYGENVQSAPILIDGKRCGPFEISSDDKEIRITFPEQAANPCVDALVNARELMLPLIHKGGLLRIRMEGAAPALNAARNACRGGRVATVQPTPSPSPVIAPPPAQTGAPPKPDNAGPLAARAREFVDDYFRQTQAESSLVLAYVRRSYGAEIRYYGKTVPLTQVIEEKRRYLARWPERSYRVKPEATRIECDEARAACQVIGELDYQARNPGEAKVSAGSASYDLRIVFAREGPRIVEENGRTLARRN